jgi:hypothetical protein
MDHSIEGSQNRSRIRRMDDITALASQDAVELIFPAQGEALASPFAQTMKIPPVVPATGLLAQISAQSALVSELGAGHFRGCLGESRVAGSNALVSSNLGQGGQRTNGQSSFSCAGNTLQFLFQSGQADEFVSSEYFIPKTAQQVAPSGQDISTIPF